MSMAQDARIRTLEDKVRELETSLARLENLLREVQPRNGSSQPARKAN